MVVKVIKFEQIKYSLQSIMFGMFYKLSLLKFDVGCPHVFSNIYDDRDSYNVSNSKVDFHASN